MSADLGYHSHYPILASIISRTTGPVLELGMGYGSTPMLHTMTQPERTLWSVETDQEWFERLSFLGNARHTVELCSSWESCRALDQASSFEVVFIDSSPGEKRKDLALLFKDTAKYVILHDAECDTMHGGGGNYQYEKILPEFKYAEVYRLVRPHTLILSNLEEYGLGDHEGGSA